MRDIALEQLKRLERASLGFVAKVRVCWDEVEVREKRIPFGRGRPSQSLKITPASSGRDTKRRMDSSIDDKPPQRRALDNVEAAQALARRAKAKCLAGGERLGVQAVKVVP